MSSLRAALLVPVFGLAIAGCDRSSATTSTAPSPAKCQVSATLAQSTIAAGGGSGVVTVTAAPECAWTASTNVSWVSNLSPTSGQGNGEVKFNVGGNSSPTPRSGQISVNTVNVALAQSGATCQYAINPSSRTLDPAPTSDTIALTTMSGCSWTATSNDPSWLSVTAGSSGDGNGTVRFAVPINNGAVRVGSITIGDQVFSVRQNGSCLLTLNPTSQSIVAAGGSGGPINVTTATGCTWSATTTANWISLGNPSSGNGTGAVSFSVSANTGSSRTGSIAIGGQTFTVNQAGSCALSINPTSQSLAAAAGPGGPIAVTTAAGCSWSATTPDNWIALGNPSSGNGNSSVSFTVTANNGAARTGSIAIGGQTFTVNQAGTCATTLSPASQSIAAAGGAAAPITVTTAGGCTWTATTGDSWIALGNPSSGNGNGSVSFTVAATAGPARTGTITIAGQTHSVNQASGCTFSLDSSSAAFPAGGGSGGPVAVTASDGACGWTAVSNAAWISVLTGAGGTGNGAVTFQVDVNATGAPRTGTITIAGLTFTVSQS